MKTHALIAALVFFLATSSCLRAQEDEKKSDKKVSFVPAPYITYDRSLGLSGGLMPMVMYPLNSADTISPESISGLLGFYTTNNSYMVLAFNRFYLAEDRWRSTVAAGLGNINFQVATSNPILPDYISYSTGARFAFVQLQRRVFNDFYMGASYFFTYFETEFDVIIPNEDITKLHSLGIVSSYDTRSNVYYPKSGLLVNATLSSYPEFMNEDESVPKLDLDYNQYFSIGKRDVVAARLLVGAGIGDLPFQQEYIVGYKDIRGYTQGDYRGNGVIAAQGEYRWNFHKKMGVVGFAGMATVLDASDEANNGKLLPAIGAGYRYTVFPKNNMNIGLDAALGVGDWGIYFRIGEAF